MSTPEGPPRQEDSASATPTETPKPSPSLPKEEMLKLMIGQLAEYGHNDLAMVLQEHTKTFGALEPTSKLASLCQAGKQTETFPAPSQETPDNSTLEDTKTMEEAAFDLTLPEPPLGPLMDFSQDAAHHGGGKRVPYFLCTFRTTHKEAVRCARFNQTGRYVATGSMDASIKIIDMTRVKEKHRELRPVVRALYGHVGPVTDIAFHPNGLTLVSASEDQTIKLYDLAKPHNKRALLSAQDFFPVNSVDFSPTGEHIVTGAGDHRFRLYDTRSLQCFTTKKVTSNEHRSGINTIRYAPTGKFLVTGGQDGDIRFWDTVSGTSLRSLAQAHGGAPISSTTFSKSGQYMLTGGQDSVGKLWDLRTGRVLQTYSGASQRMNRITMSFSYDESFIYSSDENSRNVFCWDSKSGQIEKAIPGHDMLVRSVAGSPVDEAFLTCW
ncbi:WD40-repeat-containing domain protein [Piptocephalis cylindrospora]|uniref:Cleavage stimulation factor 50 kDa subunit n=1 Tax=Piptocephalis cylindrospora TaxID=1907219 RepID=A0A4P9Y561_9FUNG|nr:WD40-repeat-containing domain protein [Piptocephalis cylindrospora]|eukprot:RKP13954.1 WD40-repeat-containing domain protein [Piptocephalis cylindrospora]